MRAAAQPAARATTDATLSHNGDWVGSAASTAAVAAASRTTATVTRTLRCRRRPVRGVEDGVTEEAAGTDGEELAMGSG